MDFVTNDMIAMLPSGPWLVLYGAALALLAASAMLASASGRHDTTALLGNVVWIGASLPLVGLLAVSPDGVTYLWLPLSGFVLLSVPSLKRVGAQNSRARAAAN